MTATPRYIRRRRAARNRALLAVYFACGLVWAGALSVLQ